MYLVTSVDGKVHLWRSSFQCFFPSNYVLKPSEGKYSQTSIFTSFLKLNKPKFHEEGKKNIFYAEHRFSMGDFGEGLSFH